MRHGPLLRATIGLLLVPLISGPVPFTAPDGDLDRDGKVNVVDIQCQVLVLGRTIAAGEPEEDLCGDGLPCEAEAGPGHYCRPGLNEFAICLPVCLDATVALGASQATDCSAMTDDYVDADCRGKVAKHNADLNCDGKIGNEDFGFLVAILLSKLGSEGSADEDGDGRLNFCDDDSDGDGAADAADCAVLDPAMGSCDDDNPCSEDSCLDGKCFNVGLDEGAPCEDGNSCTLGDTCQGGECSGTPLVCQDQDPCTEDVCVNGECLFLKIDGCSICPGGCDDNDVCTDDSCVNSKCVHSPIWGCTTCGKACGGQSSYGCWCDEACFWGNDCCMDVCVHCNFCAGKDCGSDACGNWCGSCPWPQECYAGGMCL